MDKYPTFVFEPNSSDLIFVLLKLVQDHCLLQMLNSDGGVIVWPISLPCHIDLCIVLSISVAKSANGLHSWPFFQHGVLTAFGIVSELQRILLFLLNAGVVTIVGYLRTCEGMHFRKASLFGLVSMYLMSPPARASRAKFHWGIAFATGLKRFTDPETKLRKKHTNREEEPTEQPRALNKYGFVDHPELQRNEFSPPRPPQREGNMNGWLIEDEDEPLEHEALDKVVD
ncbi:hypothetical protein Tco_1362553 [Tanacetum coccineum]